MATAAKLPFFVYGTLMTPYGNHAIRLGGKVKWAKPALLSGARLVHFGGFPGLYEATEDARTVLGELIAVKDDIEYATVLAALDQLEAFYGDGDERNMYDRVVRTVHVVGEAGEPPVAHDAYVYVCKVALAGSEHVEVPPTDAGWHAFMQRLELRDATDDWQDHLEAKA